MVKTEESAGAVIQRCSVNKVFENLCKIQRKIPVLDYQYFVLSYQVYIFLSEARLEKGEVEHKNYLRITPECFDDLILLMKDDITK